MRSANFAINQISDQTAPSLKIAEQSLNGAGRYVRPFSKPEFHPIVPAQPYEAAVWSSKGGLAKSPAEPPWRLKSSELKAALPKRRRYLKIAVSPRFRLSYPIVAGSPPGEKLPFQGCPAP